MRPDSRRKAKKYQGSEISGVVKVKVNNREPGSYPAIIPQPVPGVIRSRGTEPAGEAKTGKPGQISFGDVLSAEFEKSGGLKISAHARRRLMERNVTLDREDMRKIEGAVHRAASKGSRESLVIYGDLALVASVKNRTIITAMDIEGKDMKDHVFTNIDSAVIVK